MFPMWPLERETAGSIIIDKTNSELPELISMPSCLAVFRGTVKTNPLGNTGKRDNYIFGNSMIKGSLEIDVPLELRMNNLQFTDTVENFLKIDDRKDDNPFNPDDLEFLNIKINAENGFPAGGSVSLILHDSVARTDRSAVHAKDVLKAATVDDYGRVMIPAESNTIIELTKEFWDSVDQSDNIILKFTLNTSGDGMKDVKFFSDYRIAFTAGLVFKHDLSL